MGSRLAVYDGTDEGQACCVIETPGATYFYQTEAGGFSSIVDRSGLDWIGFSPGPICGHSGAAHVYRGIPNAVWPDNIGHPGYRFCSSTWFREEDRVVIRTRSNDDAWVWEWAIGVDVAEFKMLRADPDRRYWFLYEGVVGGAYQPSESFWGAKGRRRSYEHPQLFGDTEPCCVSEQFSWVYFGANRIPRVLFLARTTPGPETDLLAYMKADHQATDGMVVFGFGRAPGPTPLLRGQNAFMVGFVEATEHDSIIDAVESRLQRNCSDSRLV